MKRLRNILQDYVAGDLNEAQRADIEHRIEKEPRVRKLHEEILEAHRALTSLRDRPEPPVSAEDALPRIQAAITAQRYGDRPELHMDGAGRRYYKRVAMAATLLLAITVGMLVMNKQGGDSGTPDSAPAFSGIESRPSADVRGLVDAASAGSLDALTVIEMLKKAGAKPGLVFSPNEGVLPVSEGLTDKR